MDSKIVVACSKYHENGGTDEWRLYLETPWIQGKKAGYYIQTFNTIK